MGISKFMIVLIIVSVGFLFIEKENKEQIIDKTTTPLVTFLDSIMYEITEESVDQIVRSRQADIYDDKEELFDATIIVKSSKNSYETNSISSENMIKMKNQVFLTNKVNVVLDDGMHIKTEKLNYNTETKIATNDVAFVTTKNESTFYGHNLFLDSMNEYMKSDKVKLRMKVENDE